MARHTTNVAMSVCLALGCIYFVLFRYIVHAAYMNSSDAANRSTILLHPLKFDSSFSIVLSE